MNDWEWEAFWDRIYKTILPPSVVLLAIFADLLVAFLGVTLLLKIFCSP